jgi:allophanate hydrolase subunit 2
MLEVVSILGFSSFQDMGRSGFRSLGLSRSGAADYYAMAEGAALLDQSPNSTALELIGNGGAFNVLEDCMVALTGATMLASADQKPLAWNASHYLYKGNMLNLTTQQNGRYSYLHLRGGFKTPKIFNSCSAQPVAGIGQYTRPKDILAQLENKQDPLECQKIEPFNRFDLTTFRLVESFQTRLFNQETIERFNPYWFGLFYFQPTENIVRCDSAGGYSNDRFWATICAFGGLSNNGRLSTHRMYHSP